MRKAFRSKGYNVDDVLPTIKRYSQEGLDMSYIAGCQQSAIRRIQRELEKKFAGIFEGDSGSALEEMVRRYIGRLHASRRYRLRARDQLKDSSGDASDDDDDEEDEEEDSDVEFVVPPVMIEPPRQNFRVPVLASPTAAATPTSNGVRTSERRFSYAQSAPQSSLSTTSQPSTTHCDAASSRPSLTRNNDVVAVERFLDNCLPSMVHFLERFLAYGCRNPQFLLAVSTLPRDSIVELLRSLPCLGGRVMSEMEIFLLTEHFLRYSQ